MKTPTERLAEWRAAETDVALIHLDWATDAAVKAAEATSTATRLFYWNNAMRDYDLAVALLAHTYAGY